MIHHIHSVIVSFNRLELTKQAVRSYLEVTGLQCSLTVVDNGSHPGVRRWLKDAAWGYGFNVIQLDENRYPGFATNRGWENMPSQTTLLHRGDNDFAYVRGWDLEVLDRFEDPSIGQVGLRTDDEELHNPHNVGGNNVIRRELWDQGLRYDERPWPQISKEVPGYTEDSFFSPAVRKLGWEWTRVQKPCVVSLSFEDPDDPYYSATWADRGIKPPAGGSR